MKTYTRIIYTVFVLCAAIFCPYWVTLILAGIGAIIYPWYLEGVTIVFLSDILFAVPIVHLHNFVAVHTLISLIICFIAMGIKRMTRYDLT